MRSLGKEDFQLAWPETLCDMVTRTLNWLWTTLGQPAWRDRERERPNAKRRAEKQMEGSETERTRLKTETLTQRREDP